MLWKAFTKPLIHKVYNPDLLWNPHYSWNTIRLENIETMSCQLTGYVTLLDPGYMTFLYVLSQSPCDWWTPIHPNLVLTIFHTQNIYHHVCNTVRTTFWYIVVLQSRGPSPLQLENNNWIIVVLTIFRHVDTCVVCRKLSEPNLYALVSSNRGETVLECMTILCNQDLRMQLIRFVTFHLLWILFLYWGLGICNCML